MKSTSLNALDQIKNLHRTHEEENQEGWLVSYADLITLLFIFFAILLSISNVSKGKFEALTQQVNQGAATSLSQLKKELDTEIQKNHLQDTVSAEITSDGLQIQFSEKVLFASADASLSQEGNKILSDFAKILAGMAGHFKLAVEGHTDSRPIRNSIYPSNWALSSARSVTVLHFLSQNGISDKKMMIHAFADTKPIAPDDLAKNRRVTLLVF